MQGMGGMMRGILRVVWLADSCVTYFTVVWVPRRCIRGRIRCILRVVWHTDSFVAYFTVVWVPMRCMGGRIRGILRVVRILLLYEYRCGVCWVGSGVFEAYRFQLSFFAIHHHLGDIRHLTMADISLSHFRHRWLNRDHALNNYLYNFSQSWCGASTTHQMHLT